MYVVQEIKETIDALREDCIVIDAPLLFESKLDQICDFVIGMMAKEEEKIERICKRDGISKEMAKKRLNIQMSEEELQKRADYVIINDGNMETLEEEIKKVWKEKKE
ncbi:MAG: dephospho-CoA kinase [Clostridia bacterium]|nr:dephospho-CoA kinase [Clostridia bacterium]